MKRLLAVTPFCLLFLSTAGTAQETGKAALDEWVQNYTALGMDVAYGFAAQDGDALNVTDLTYEYQTTLDFSELAKAFGEDTTADPPKIEIRFTAAAPDSRVEGISSDETGFTAQKWSFTDTVRWTASVTVPDEDPFEIRGELEGYEITNLFEPRLEPVSEESDEVLKHLQPLMSYVLNVRYDESRIDRMSYEPGPDMAPDVAAAIGTYEATDTVVKNFANGRMGEYSQKESRSATQTPMDDGGVLNTSSTVGVSTMTGLDLKPILAVLDPDTVGSLESTTVLESSAITDYRMAFDDFKVAISSMTSGEMGFDYQGDSLSTVLESALQGETVRPEEFFPGFIELYRAFSIEEMLTEGVSFEGQFPEEALADVKGGIEQIALKGLSSSGLGNFSIEGLTFAAGEDIQFRLGKYNLGNIDFAPYGPMKALLERALSGEDLSGEDPLDMARVFAPRSLEIGLASLLVKGPLDETDPSKILELGVANAHAIMATTAPPVPTDIELVSNGVALPIELLDEPIRSILSEAGIVNVLYTSEISANWDEATSEVTLTGLSFEVGDFLSIDGNASIGGVTRDMLENPDQAQLALAGLIFNSAELDVTNINGVQALLRFQAKSEGESEAEFKEGLTQDLTGLVGSVGDEAFQTMVTNAITTFLNDPKSLKILVSPQSPVPFAELLGMAAVAPQALPTRLGVSVLANQ